MSEIITPPPIDSEPAPNRIRWTRQQCEAIREAGVLTGRYELIDGEILSKMGQNSPHRIAIALLQTWLAKHFGWMNLQIQGPIQVATPDSDYNEPEPDLVVTPRPATDYSTGHAVSDELLLLVEVSDTTLQFDLGKKARLYARAGVRDYWVVDVSGGALYTHRQPAEDGYGEIRRYQPREEVALLVRPDVRARVADLLPPGTP